MLSIHTDDLCQYEVTPSPLTPYIIIRFLTIPTIKHVSICAINNNMIIQL